MTGAGGWTNLGGKIDMNIEPIENNEAGSSVRAKLNRLITAMTVESFLTASTIDDTQTEMLIPDETEPRLVVPVDTAWAFEIDILCFQVPSGLFVGVWKVEGAIFNDAGTVSLGQKWDSSNPTYSTGGLYDPAKDQGDHLTVTVIVGDTSNTFGDPQVDADVGNSSLRIRVTATGYVSTAFEWAARVSIVQVSIA